MAIYLKNYDVTSLKRNYKQFQSNINPLTGIIFRKIVLFGINKVNIKIQKLHFILEGSDWSNM